MTDIQQPEAGHDRIERSIDIDAPAEDVFALVARPGWWINQGSIDPDPRVTVEGDVTVLVHEQWGTFRVQSLHSDPPRSVTFRWLDRDDPSVGTTVEFAVENREGGGVRLTVVETGFTQLGNTPAQVVEHVRENTEGWESELGAAQRFITAPST